jgi:hypothetical protein
MNQLLIYRFDAAAQFQGQLVGALERMESGGALRIVQALFLARDRETGELAALDLRSRGAGSLVAPLLGFRLDAGEGGRGTERALAPEGGDMPRAVADALPRGAAIAAVLVEHTWAQALDDAVARTGGTAVTHDLVEVDTLDDAVALLVAAARGD